MKTHQLKDFKHLVGTLDGLSSKQIEQHLGLYAGYVNKYNEIQEKLTSVDKTKANYSFGDFSELKRREAVAWNGTILHELYFEALTSNGKAMSDKLKSTLEKNFGSVENWEKDLRGCAASTPGWVLLTMDLLSGELNHWVVYEHHIGLPANQKIILALDCWEHAFMIDYGTAKPSYVDTFLKHLDWSKVESRI